MLLLWFQFYSNVQLALTPFLLCDKFYIFFVYQYSYTFLSSFLFIYFNEEQVCSNS